MNEKAYKTMSLAGAAGITVGIIVMVTGVAAGISSLVSGAEVLKDKKNIAEKEVADLLGRKGSNIFESQKKKGTQRTWKSIICPLHRVPDIFSYIFRLVWQNGRDAGIPL